MRFFGALFIVLFLFVPTLGSAQTQVYDQLVGSHYSSSEASGIYFPTTPAGIIGTVLRALFGISGVVFLILILYSGFLWMTAAGNADRVSRAKSVMLQAIIGLALMIAAYSITTFVFTQIEGINNAPVSGQQ